MSSKRNSQAGPVTYDVVGTPETMYHFPISPGEPGKFDFYRAYVTNQAHHSDVSLSENSDAPILSSSTSTPSATKRRWTPFADLVSSNSLNCSTASSTNDSSAGSSTNSIRTNSSFSTLTDAVKHAMNRGHLDVSSTTPRRPASGATLSSKDLNHLSPQSM